MAASSVNGLVESGLSAS